MRPIRGRFVKQSVRPDTALRGEKNSVEALSCDNGAEGRKMFVIGTIVGPGMSDRFSQTAVSTRSSAMMVDVFDWPGQRSQL